MLVYLGLEIIISTVLTTGTSTVYSHKPFPRVVDLGLDKSLSEHIA